MAKLIEPLWYGAFNSLFVTQKVVGGIIQLRNFDRYYKPIPPYLKPKEGWQRSLYTWLHLSPEERQIYNDYETWSGVSGFQLYTLDYVNTEEEPYILPDVVMVAHLEAELIIENGDPPHIKLWWWAFRNEQLLEDIKRWAIYKGIDEPPSIDRDHLVQVVKNIYRLEENTNRPYQILLQDYNIAPGHLYRYRITAVNRFPEQSGPSNVAAIFYT